MNPPVVTELTRPDKQRTILIVEDDDDNREIVRVVVEEIVGARAELVVDGMTAIARAREVGPRAIILDLGLPSLSGLEVARFLKQDAELSSIPIIVLSAFCSEKVRARVREAGCDRFVEKPFELNDLAAIISEYL